MNRIAAASFASLASFAVLAACAKSPDEIAPSPAAAAPPKAANTASATATASTTTTTSASSATAEPSSPPAAPAAGGVVQHGGEDPLGGKFTLADATKGLTGTGPLTATITTSMGALSCKLYDDKAPNTVANFVGLARGLRPWKAGGDWVKRPSYDGTTFHRIIKGFMIQGGDPEGTGRGEPGYVINDEIWPGAKHDRAGLLCMANRGHNTNGQQIFITDAAASYLDGNYTIFGECSPEQTIHDLAAVPVTGDHPNSPPLIKSVTITRGAPSK
jgi:peptidyl-prolyl cis-trans isomerase A (cyclophilin A)